MGSVIETRNGVVYSKEEGSTEEKIVGWTFTSNKQKLCEDRNTATISAILHHPV